MPDPSPTPTRPMTAERVQICQCGQLSDRDGTCMHCLMQQEPSAELLRAAYERLCGWSGDVPRQIIGETREVLRLSAEKWDALRAERDALREVVAKLSEQQNG